MLMENVNWSKEQNVLECFILTFIVLKNQFRKNLIAVCSIQDEDVQC